MITVQEAKRLMLEETALQKVVEVPYAKAIQRFLSKDIEAPFDHPLFDQSAVDGYAFAYEDSLTTLKMVGEIAAGEVLEHVLKPGECARIFTGAMLPEGADTVVMQEFVSRNLDHVTHSDRRLKKGSNVRFKGEQFKIGDAVLMKGTRLGGTAIGLLMSVGVARIPIHASPRIALVITGSEFTATEFPKEGRIFSSNDAMLMAALAQEGLECTIHHSPDDPDALRRVLREALSDHDVVLTTGGVSVGEHDRVKETLEELGARIIFHKVAQKPGKPMLFARRERTAIFGLPGNPRAVMVLFWEYVLPYLRAVQGAAEPFLRNEQLPIREAVVLKGERAEFRAATVRDGQVRLLRDEGSHMLASLVHADALVFFPHTLVEVKAGERVEVHYLPVQ